MIDENQNIENCRQLLRNSLVDTILLLDQLVNTVNEFTKERESDDDELLVVLDDNTTRIKRLVSSIALNASEVHEQIIEIKRGRVLHSREMASGLLED